ncbi:bifunctional 4-hydroxy-2-oxoglutarate aldolase/2-dehydro-3-deoxy-phosphogluconate aldolase [Botrimarina hoheduenensis]|uniref:Putative KHG/KDPG aldolase n=1 Tax=Botrimarina hoheduenensis TaxID=2528000 RepID=A0A5C5VR98_9BACT|nr:bifunctional 4-hydroxy-2-oxoglutarate aldolase/2-dehydro-3-deoxy-phosphogluconate aldolase [Botrimarina hoheduenensis]TWT40680.1 putative KHG/KDPG aldolase [Botrimarina hoheduenensis]
MDSADRVFEELARRRLVPVVSEPNPDAALRVADALVSAGLPVVELALRAEGAMAALRAIARRGDVIAIAGTVLTAEQVDQAADAGAQMIVSPGLSEVVVKRCFELQLPVCPGVATPTEVQAALSLGVANLKFFPAEAVGGIAMLKALSGPFPQVRFMPTGGISPGNVRDYLALHCVIACGGSWMVSPSLYEDGRFSRVESAAREAVRLVAELN